MEADKYRTVFGNEFLESSLVLSSSIDWLSDEERKEAKAELSKEMKDKFKMDFVNKDFSIKMNDSDEMVSDALQSLAKLPPYSNAAI